MAPPAHALTTLLLCTLAPEFSDRPRFFSRAQHLGHVRPGRRSTLECCQGFRLGQLWLARTGLSNGRLLDTRAAPRFSLLCPLLVADPASVFQGLSAAS